MSEKQKHLDAFWDVVIRRKNWIPRSAEAEFEIACCGSNWLTAHEPARRRHLASIAHIAFVHGVSRYDLFLMVYLSKYLPTDENLWRATEVIRARNRLTGKRLSRPASLKLARTVMKTEAFYGLPI